MPTSLCRHLNPSFRKLWFPCWTGFKSLEYRAFATIIKNRVNQGGVFADGANFIKNGENGKGVMSRWYPETLKRRILAIAQVTHKIRFIENDAFEICAQNADRREVVYFIYPPYMKAGGRLYRHSAIDHEALFGLASRLQGNFLITYDDDGEVQELVNRHEFDINLIAMKNTHHARKTELLIGQDLGWIKM
jgi:DNA adenine methylase